MFKYWISTFAKMIASKKNVPKEDFGNEEKLKHQNEDKILTF